MSEGIETIRILVRAPNWIGDAVMAVPAVEALKGLYPDSSITVLTRAGALAVFENNPAVDGLMEYDSSGAHAGVRGRIALARELKAEGFTLAVLLQNAFDAALVTYLARIPERIGYARDMRSTLLTKAVPVTDEVRQRHQVFYYLNIIEKLGGTVPEAPVPRLYVSDAERRSRDAFLGENGLAGSRLIGAAPGASYGPAKRWSPECFAAVLDRLAAELDAVPLVFGGPGDAEACALVASRPGHRKIDLAGRTTVREFIALLELMEVFITNDSGPMHLSAASGVPTVAVFGSTDARATGPLGPLTTVVQKDIDCSPCLERECRFGHYDCLSSITADDVCAAAAALIGHGAGACDGR